MAVEPRLAPFVGPTPFATKPQLRGVPLIDTLAAQFDISGSPIVQQNLDHIFGKREYDPNFNVDTFLEGKALNQMEINSIKNNSATFEDATNQYERVLDNQNTQRILESSSGLALMITDPINIATIAIPLAAPITLRAGAAALGRTAIATATVDTQAYRSLTAATRGIEDVADAVAAYRITNALELSKIAAGETLVLEGMRANFRALNNISLGSNPTEELMNAASYTSMMTGAAAVLGYGLGRGFFSTPAERAVVTNQLSRFGTYAADHISALNRPLPSIPTKAASKQSFEILDQSIYKSSVDNKPVRSLQNANVFYAMSNTTGSKGRQTSGLKYEVIEITEETYKKFYQKEGGLTYEEFKANKDWDWGTEPAKYAVVSSSIGEAPKLSSTFPNEKSVLKYFNDKSRAKYFYSSLDNFDDFGESVWRLQDDAKVYKNMLQENGIEVSPRIAGQFPAPEFSGKFDFAAKWWTDSIFYKMVPTPLKNVIGNKDLPDWFKLSTLRMVNDRGVLIELNRLGETLPDSVLGKSVNRNKDWYAVSSVLDEEWAKLNPRGGAQLLDIPVQNAIENLRKVFGTENFTKQDWYDHVGRLYITNAKGTSQSEIRAVRAIEDKLGEYRVQLEKVGFLPNRDILVEEVARKSEVVGSMESAVESIVARNSEWLDTELTKAAANLEAKITKRNDLGNKFKTRGLTAKQQELYDKLLAEIGDTTVRLDRIRNASMRLKTSENIDDLIKFQDELMMTEGMQTAFGKLSTRITEMADEIAIISEVVAKQAAKASERFFPRMYNKPKIAVEREQFLRTGDPSVFPFRAKLINHFRANPSIYGRDEVTGKFIRRELASDEASLAARADAAIDNILEIVDEDMVDDIIMSGGRGKHLLQRSLDIPTSELVDYIATNAKEVMISYVTRIGAKIDFAETYADDLAEFATSGKRTGPATIKKLSELFRKRLASDGLNENQINEAMKNFLISYNRVVGSVIRNPDAMSNKIAVGLRSAANWAFLGAAGLSALGDASALLLDNEMRTVAKSLLAPLNNMNLKLAKKELQMAGEMLDIAKGVVSIRYMENVNSGTINKSVFDKLNNGYFLANGLGQVTQIMKLMNGMAVSHTIIEASQRIVSKSASDWEVTFLARYGIDASMAKRIASMPSELSENSLILPNTAAWTDDGAVVAFRSALRNNVSNRVVYGTAADKPQMVDGVAYVPMSVGRLVGMTEDPIVKGYARIENGLMSLPFTFYNYSLGALNKITTNYAQDAVRNKFWHFSTSMFLGYMIVKSKTPAWAWDKMDADDRMLRAFDFSGNAAIYSDIFYRGLAGLQDFGISNPTPFEPKFKSKPDTFGGIISLGGAPADWTYGTMQAVNEFVNGNYQDGAKRLIPLIPFSGVIVAQGEIRDSLKAIAGHLPNRQ